MSAVLLFASDVPLQEVPYPPDFSIHFNIDEGTVNDGGRDDGFCIFQREQVLELATEKPYCAELEWRFTPGRAKKVIDYLRAHLETAPEVEFWHIWQDMDFGHKVRKITIPIDELSVEDIQELCQLEVWKQPATDYCYVVTGGTHFCG